jgi:hypothetical protein
MHDNLRPHLARALAALVLFPLGCDDAGTIATRPPPVDTDPPVLGAVAGAGTVACPTTAPSGAACSQVTVSCPRMDDLGAVVVASAPAGPVRASVLLHNNLGGTQLLDDGFVDAYHGAGFRVVQVQWQSDWEQSTIGLKHAACRYATLLEWIFTNVHSGDRSRGFCAQSYGGGSGGLFFSLAHYGAADVLDAVTVSEGPPFARVDLGCTPSTPPRAACPELPSVPVAYSGGVLQIISQWEVAPSCGSDGAASAEVNRWASDSILSPGATLAFPQTSLAAWYCTNGFDATLGQGSLLFDQVTTDKSVHCVGGGDGGGACSGQAPWPSALPDMVADMAARCIPRH